MNPFIKNNRTGFYDDILNRTSHYCKILLTRTTIHNKMDKDYGFLLEDPKFKKETEVKRLKSNDELMRSLIKIERKSNRYKTESESQISRKKSLKSSFIQKQKELAISQGNIRLYKKILKADSDFSNQKLKQFDQKITNYSKLIKHPFKQIYQMDKQLFTTYRLQLFKNQSNIRKQQSLDLTNKINQIKEVKSHKKYKKFRKRNSRLLKSQQILLESKREEEEEEEEERPIL